MSQFVGTDCVPCGMLELAARPSHYAHFCALSRYGVTTERSDLSNFRWTLSVASGMLGLREILARFIRRRFRDRPLRPSRRAIILFVLLFTFAAIYLLYEGITSSNYLLVALVLLAYMFILGLEARLSLRPPRPSKNSKPAKKSTR